MDKLANTTFAALVATVRYAYSLENGELWEQEEIMGRVEVRAQQLADEIRRVAAEEAEKAPAAYFDKQRAQTCVPPDKKEDEKDAES